VFCEKILQAMTRVSLDSANVLEYRDTPWDQRVLGYNTNEILSIEYNSDEKLRRLLQLFEADCLERGVLFTVSRIDASRVQLKTIMHQHGFYLAEISLQLLKTDMQQSNFSSEKKLNLKLEKPQDRDFMQMQEIARDDFHFGRILEDPNIEPQNARARSFHWIEDLRRQQKEFWVIRQNEHVIGFWIQQVEDTKASLILAGTAEKASMLALPFWKMCLQDLQSRNVQEVRTLISAANVRAVNLYRHLEFKFERSLLGLHRMRNA
jgi:hypothetical protein